MNDILRHIVPAFLMWLPWGFAAASEAGPSCGDCYHIDTTTLISVVIGDVFLTVVIILVVYYCTKQSFQKKHKDDDRKVYMNMPIR